MDRWFNNKKVNKRTHLFGVICRVFEWAVKVYNYIYILIPIAPKFEEILLKQVNYSLISTTLLLRITLGSSVPDHQFRNFRKTMSDTEVEKKGRAAKNAKTQEIELSPRKRGRPTGPVKPKPVEEEVSDEPSAPKRGRGRPRKLNAVPKPKTGRGRGRPRKDGTTSKAKVNGSVSD